MIEIRASANDVDISGAVAELQAIRTAILRLINSADDSYTVGASTLVDPLPYERLLGHLKVIKGSGPARVQIEGKNLVVVGSAENLAIFASRFTFGPDAAPGEHNHYEYLVEEDIYVAVDSVPLVIGVSHSEA